MKRIVVDAESFYSVEFSLRKLAPILYVRDPQFLVQGLGIKIDDAPATWHTGDDIEEALRAIDWSDARLVAHNLAGFDGLVLHERYGIVPAQRTDTLGLARAFLPTGLKHGLDDVGSYLGLGRKVAGTLESLKGIREPNPEQLAALGEYCIQDVELCAGIDDLLYPMLPEGERAVIDTVIRMSTQAVLHLDKAILAEEIEAAKAARKQTLEAGELPLAVLSSNDQFFEHLKTLVPDEDLPRKENAKGKTIPALGKADAPWAELKSKYPELGHVFEARENAKSNIRATRAATYQAIAHTPAGTLPVPYAYYGAGTGRLSSTGKLGAMNLPSTRTSKLRKAILAPPGHVLHVTDSAAIELRMRLWLCGSFETLEEMHHGRDLYIETAAAIFGVPPSQVTKTQRHIGKVTLLGAQFGMGWRRYQAYLRAGPMGAPPMSLSDEEAQNAIRTFRDSNEELRDTWQFMSYLLGLLNNETADLEWRSCRIKYQHIILPNGMFLDYSGLTQTEEGDTIYGLGSTQKFIHPGLLLENLCQALARIVVVDQCMDIDRRIAPIVMFTHDEGIFVGTEDGAEERQAEIESAMCVTPRWAPRLFVGAEGSFARAYSK